MMAQKYHNNKTTTVHHLPKKWLILSFCGGAYQTFGEWIESKWIRGNNKNKILNNIIIK